jgi:CheY-like chemotaxis protein
MEKTMASVQALRLPEPELSGWPRTNEDNLEVLVVEDDEADAFLIRSALRSIPRVSQIVLAHDGVEALQWLDSGVVEPDVVIIDLHMPRKNGFSLLVELRCRSKPGVTTIVLTSSKASADAARSKLRGADCFLTKPDTIEELNWLIAKAVSKIN